MSRWIKVARSQQIKEKKPWPLVIDGKKIVLIRHRGCLTAFKDSCPHQGAPLSHGFVKDGQITCIYHGWKFNLDDGSFLSNDKLKLKSYGVKEQANEVFLEIE